MKKLTALILALALLLSLTSLAAAEEKTLIRYSKSQGPYTELFEDAIIPILEAKGYTFEVVEASDLLVADKMLEDGDVDVNVEQHTAYIETFFNPNNDGHLVGISPIPTVPAGLFSARHASLDEVGEGMTVAVVNDASNMARCLLILQKIGWIKFDPDVDITKVTPDDIIENPYNLEIIPMLNVNIPTSLEDFDFGLITGSIVWNAREIVDPSSALAQEDILPHLVLQVTVKEQDKDAAWAQAIVDAYHSDEFKAFMETYNTGMWWIPEELR
jgi:D-methionine transport system substrate-binding protein